MRKVQHTLPIVGAHFRPPAKAILANLAGGTELLLVPEPSNPYDSNAIQVCVRSSEISPVQTAALDLAAGPYGFSASDIFAKDSWHLGYIPRESAAEYIDDLLEWLAENEGETFAGKLTFDPAGGPLVEFHL